MRSFLVKLAARSPEPAGGSALALAAASAAALMSLSCAEDEDASRSPRLAACHAASESLRRDVQELIDEDAGAYRQVRRSLGMPQGTDQEREARRQALDQALVLATEVPLAVAEAGLAVLELSISAAEEARISVLGDLAASIHLAEAAVKGSLRNARINANGSTDPGVVRPLLERAATLDSRLQDLTRRADRALQARGYGE